MIDLSCNYLGLKLKNPLVAGSCGLTSTLENLKVICQKGAGAVVLKSIFEEQIKYESNQWLNSDAPEIKPWQEAFQSTISKKEYYYDEAYEYLTGYAREHTLNQYLSLITGAKKAIDIPVIASINCNTHYDWQYFAKRIQEAGADALELNVYLLPSDFEKSGPENEKVYFEIIREVRKTITIPLSLKIGYYFSSLAQTALQLSETGISGLTLFNRPYNPDININTMEINSSNMFSRDSEYPHTLRWVALLAGKLKCHIAASTGIHNSETVIKQILAGADAVHLASAFYKHHFDVLPEIIKGMDVWMAEHKYTVLSEFKGLLSTKNIGNPASYERVQFLRLFSGNVS
jgi:dihydroorotate dehydrogenase (fumarate)